MGQIGSAFVEIVARSNVKPGIAKAQSEVDAEAKRRLGSYAELERADRDAEARRRMVSISAGPVRPPVPAAVTTPGRTASQEEMDAGAAILRAQIAARHAGNTPNYDYSRKAATIIGDQRVREGDTERWNAERIRKPHLEGDVQQRRARLYETDSGRALREKQLDQEQLSIQSQKRIGYVDTEIKLGKFAANVHKANDALVRFIDPALRTGLGIGGAIAGGAGVMGGLMATGRHFVGTASPAAASQFDYAMRDLTGTIGLSVMPTFRGFTKDIQMLSDYMVTQGYTKGATAKPETGGLLKGAGAAAAWFLPSMIPGIGQVSLAIKGLSAIGGYFLGGAASERLKAGAIPGASLGLGGSEESGRFMSSDQMYHDVTSRLLQLPIEMNPMVAEQQKTNEKLDALIGQKGGPRDVQTKFNRFLGLGPEWDSLVMPNNMGPRP